MHELIDHNISRKNCGYENFANLIAVEEIMAIHGLEDIIVQDIVGFIVSFCRKYIP